MHGEAREVELKFTIDPDIGGDVLAWLSQGRRHTRRALISRYFDTDDMALRRAGYALRTRYDGEAWLQTIKGATTHDGKLGRGEWEAPVQGPGPDLVEARRTPAGRVLNKRSRVGERFAVDVSRESVEIRTPEAVIDACLDVGAVTVGERVCRLNEIELELTSGDCAALFSLARRLQETWPVHVSTVTKADRGFALAEDTDLVARHFQTPRLAGRMSAGDAFRVMARAALDQIVWNAEIFRATPSVEAIHQTRVGARRLRATLATFKSVVKDARWARIRQGLRWLSGELDAARDIDVFLDGAWNRTESGADGEDPAPLAAREAAYERARAAVAGARFGAVVLETMAWIETGPWTFDKAEGARRRDRSVARFAAAWLRQRRRGLIASGAHLGRLSPEARHRVRIQAKGLRYVADVFDQLFDSHSAQKAARRFLDRLEALLAALGDLNDASTAMALAPGFAHASRIVACEAARAATLTAAAVRAFKAFKATRPFWTDKT